MCEKRTAKVFLFSLTIGLIIEICLFLSSFYMYYNARYDIVLDLSSSLIISLPISNILTIIIFFIVLENTNLFQNINELEDIEGT